MSRNLLVGWGFVLLLGVGSATFAAEGRKSIEAKLDDKAQLELLKGTTLEEGLNLISRQFGFPIEIDGRALSKAGVKPDVPVELSIKDVSLRGALVALLKPLDLVWHVGDDVMTVTTPRGLERIEQGPAEERIENRLYSETDLQILEGTTLEEAIDLIARRHDIPILPAWNGALADESIDRDLPVSLQVTGVTLQSALKLLLEPLGLTWVIEDEVLKITTQAAADRILETRVYDVRKLEDGGIEPDRLAEALRETVRPHTWKRHGPIVEARDDGQGRRRLVRSEPDSGAATVVPLPGLLVVSQSQGAHAEIVELLERITDVLYSQDEDDRFVRSAGDQDP